MQLMNNYYDMIWFQLIFTCNRQRLQPKFDSIEYGKASGIFNFLGFRTPPFKILVAFPHSNFLNFKKTYWDKSERKHPPSDFSRSLKNHFE